MRLLVVPGDSWPGPGREVSVQPGSPSLASLLEQIAAQLGICGEITAMLAWDEDFEEWVAVESLGDDALTGETVPNREKQIGGSGGSLEPPGPLLELPGPLLTHLHTVYIWRILSAFLRAWTPWLRGPVSPRLGGAAGWA